jgi:hypothetical protein
MNREGMQAGHDTNNRAWRALRAHGDGVSGNLTSNHFSMTGIRHQTPQEARRRHAQHFAPDGTPNRYDAVSAHRSGSERHADLRQRGRSASCVDFDVSGRVDGTGLGGGAAGHDAGNGDRGRHLFRLPPQPRQPCKAATNISRRSRSSSGITSAATSRSISIAAGQCPASPRSTLQWKQQGRRMRASGRCIRRPRGRM